MIKQLADGGSGGGCERESVCDGLISSGYQWVQFLLLGQPEAHAVHGEAPSGYHSQGFSSSIVSMRNVSKCQVQRSAEESC